MKDPAAHHAHETPLAERIVDDLIGEYIAFACTMAKTTTGKTTPEEQAAQKAIDQLRHLHLAGWDYRLTPRILDALRRAGLLTDTAEHG